MIRIFEEDDGVNDCLVKCYFVASSDSMYAYAAPLIRACVAPLSGLRCCCFSFGLF